MKKAVAEEKKERLIEQLGQARTSILDLADLFPSSKRDEVFLGTWALMDLLAHLAGWDYANIEAIHAVLQSQLPAFYADHDRDWRTFNSRLVSQYKTSDYAELTARVRSSHEALLALVKEVAADELFKDVGVRFKGYKVIIARLLQSEAEDEKTHLNQIRTFYQTFSVT